MRCLYCGKELALFKRLTRSEFCSDAHRQRYQQEFTGLALSRLLKGPTKEPAPGEAASAQTSAGSKDASRPKTMSGGAESTGADVESPALRRRRLTHDEAGEAPLASVPAERTGSEQGALWQKILQKSAAAQAPARAGDDVMPPASLSGFLNCMPDFTAVGILAFATCEADFVFPVAPALPRADPPARDGSTIHLVTAGRVAPGIVPHICSNTSSAGMGERGPELRDSVRAVPLAEIRLNPAGGTVPAYSQKPVEVSLKPTAPQDPPRWWNASSREFPAPEAALGELARLAFATAGWEQGEAGATGGEAAGQVQHSPEQAGPVVEVRDVELARLNPGRPAPMDWGRPAPIHFEPVRINPVFMERIGAPAGRAVEPLPEPAAAPAAPPVPKPVTKPMPVTLHGLAPARGKPTPVYPPASQQESAIQLPRLSALPLRPTMVLRTVPPAPPAISSVDPEPKVAEERPGLAPTEEAEPRILRARVRKPEVHPLKLRLKEELKPGPEAPPKRSEEAKPVESKPAEGSTPEAAVTKVANGEAATSKAVTAEARRAGTAATIPDVGAAGVKAAEPPSLSASQPASVPASQPASVPASQPASVPASQPASVPVSQPGLRPSSKPAAFSLHPGVEELPSFLQMGTAKQKKSKKHEAERVPPLESDLLGLPTLSLQAKENFWTRLPLAVRIAALAGILALAAGGIFLISRGTSAPSVKRPAITRPAVAKPAASAPAGRAVVEAGPTLAAAGDDVITNSFAGASGRGQERHADLVPGSAQLRDNRMAFTSEIEQGGIGRVFRADNPRNFYPEKLQILRPGFDPATALAHFAVIGGKEEHRTEFPLPLHIHTDTLYKIRTDAGGGQLITPVRDEQASQSTEGGGAGLFYDPARLTGAISVVPLRLKN